ncbi:MAG: hypothetical protein ACRDKE_05555, partial [Solirubrobacterales bacterium]
MRSLIAYSLAALTAALIFSPAASASIWHAAPGGAGTACTAAAPCTANYAVVTKALDDDTVVFAGGDYTINSSLQATKWISIEGATTGVPTRFIGGPGVPITLFVGNLSGAAGAHITDVRVTNQTASGIAVMGYSSITTALTIDRVFAEATGANANALKAEQSGPGSGLIVRNTIARSTGSNGIAMSISGPINGIGAAEIRNVVAD